jgi:hypothetical protein
MISFNITLWRYANSKIIRILQKSGFMGPIYKKSWEGNITKAFRHAVLVSKAL